MNLPMMCSCNPDSKAESEAVLSEAIAALEMKAGDDFLDSVIADLDLNYNITVSFGIDQWFGVFAKSQILKDGFMIPCDSLKYGLAALFLHVKKTQKPRIFL